MGGDVTHAWILEEHGEPNDSLILGVFSSPEAAIRGLRMMSSRWPKELRPRTADFVHAENQWSLDPGSGWAYSISRWKIDDILMVERPGDGGAIAGVFA